MQSPRKGVSSAGGSDCPLGQNGYESSARTASMSVLLPRDKSNGWRGFTVSWHGPRGCRRAVKERLLSRIHAVRQSRSPSPQPSPQGEGEPFGSAIKGHKFNEFSSAVEKAPSPW